MPEAGHAVLDVLVLGGGPAGLLLASALERDVRVGLLESKHIGATSKFWLTNRARLERHALEDTIAFETDRATVGTFLGRTAVAEGSFAVIDEARLFAQLLHRCRERNVALREGEEAVSCRWTQESVVVETEKSTYRARLIVDATGGASPIAASFHLHELSGFYSILGAHLRGIRLRTLDVIGAHVLRFGDPLPSFEVIPTSATSAFCVLFVATRRLLPPESLRAAYSAHVANNPFFETTAATTELAPKLGVIPIGTPVRHHVRGLIPFGEAALVQSPLLGSAFNEVLDLSLSSAAQISDCVRNQPSGVLSVRLRSTVRKRLNDRLQLLLARALIDGDVAEFDRLTRFLQSLGPARAYRLFCTSLARRDWFAVARALIGARIREAGASATSS